MCSTLIISFLSCVFKHIKKICDLKKDFSEDEKSYSIFPAGAFAKNLFIFHFFKVTFGGISAAELLSSVACAPNYYFSSPVADKDFLTLAAFG